MPIAKRHFPNLLKASRRELDKSRGEVKEDLADAEQELEELDPVEVDNTIRNSWLAVYALQEDVTLLQENMAGSIRRGEMAADDSAPSLGFVQATTQAAVLSAPTSMTGVKLVNPVVGRIPVINGAMELEGGTATPEYNLSTQALTITGQIAGLSTLNITGAGTFLSTLNVTGATTLLSTLDITGAVTLTVPLAVPQGGTGAATFTDGGIMLGSGAGILTVLGQATDGQLPIGATGADPILAALTGTANELTVTNGSGSITLSIPSALILSGSLEVTTTSLLTGAQTLVGATEVQTSLALSNITEGNTANITRQTTTETHTLTLGTTSDTTTISIPAGALLIGVSFNVNAAVTNDGDDTWSAAFITGSTAPLATLEAAALDTKVDTMIVPEVSTAVTEIQFTPQSGSFTAGIIEIVAYFETLTSLADV
jgi:hypothetical protein